MPPGHMTTGHLTRLTNEKPAGAAPGGRELIWLEALSEARSLHSSHLRIKCPHLINLYTYNINIFDRQHNKISSQSIVNYE